MDCPGTPSSPTAIAEVTAAGWFRIAGQRRRRRRPRTVSCCPRQNCRPPTNWTVPRGRAAATSCSAMATAAAVSLTQTPTARTTTQRSHPGLGTLTHHCPRCSRFNIQTQHFPPTRVICNGPLLPSANANSIDGYWKKYPALQAEQSRD